MRSWIPVLGMGPGGNFWVSVDAFVHHCRIFSTIDLIIGKMIVNRRSICFVLLFDFYSIFWFVKFENPNADLERMVDNWGNNDANESNLSDESKCEYFKGKSTVTGLILYGSWVSPIQNTCEFLAESDEVVTIIRVKMKTDLMENWRSSWW